jgi:hypothetical protein
LNLTDFRAGNAAMNARDAIQNRVISQKPASYPQMT